MKIGILVIPALLAVCPAAASAQGSVPDTPAAREAREIAPQLYNYTDKVLFGDLWKRPELSSRDRSLVTMSVLVANGQSAQLTSHINLALTHGVKPREIAALLTQLALLAGSTNAMPGVGVARTVFAQRGIDAKELGLPDGALLDDWSRREDLAPRDRGLITVAALIARGQLEQLASEISRARNLGLTQAQTAEIATQVAFYAGWPRAMSALPAIKAAYSPQTQAALQTRAPLQIQDQGSFLVGGTMMTSPGKFDPYKPTPDGQTYRGDHAYVFYQVPVNARKYPLILWHGIGQFSKTWETTPDGREGYQNIFLRRGFSTYVLDQPRRGNAGRSMAEANIKPVPDEQNWFGVFRIGIWPDYFPGVQFSRDPGALDQYFRQITPNLGPIDLKVTTDATAKLLEKTGPAILVTHSHAGGMGWMTATRSTQVRGIVSYEPGSNFPFPEGNVPAPEPSSSGAVEAIGIPLAEFQKLTRFPIVIYYGDNIPGEPSANPGQDGWRARMAMARKWRDAVNQRGGDVTVVHLPEVGLRGNTHFPFSDLNNVEVADLMSKFLKDKKLD